jgi:hypothetical protein
MFPNFLFLRVLLGESFIPTQNLTTARNSMSSVDVIRRLVDIEVNAAAKQPFNTSSLNLQELTSRRLTNVARVSAKFALIYYRQ